LQQAQRVSGIKAAEVYADRGYRGHGCNSDSLKVWIAGAKRGVTNAIARELKRRNAVDPVIGHMKSDGRLARNFLKGAEGDAVNALLCAAWHNLRKVLQKLRLFCGQLGITLQQLLSVWRNLYPLRTVRVV
jgi:IS5 family transposase